MVAILADVYSCVLHDLSLPDGNVVGVVVVVVRISSVVRVALTRPVVDPAVARRNTAAPADLKANRGYKKVEKDVSTYNEKWEGRMKNLRMNSGRCTPSSVALSWKSLM